MTTNQPERDPSGLSWDEPSVVEAWQSNAERRADLLREATETMLDLACISVGCRVLDVAAGTGDQTMMAAHRVGPTGSVLATDTSPQMLSANAAIARREGLCNVTTRVLAAQNLDLEPDSFDAAISRHGLMLIPDPQLALVGILRALRPGGRLAVTVWSTLEHNPLHSVPFEVLQRYAGLSLAEPGQPGPLALGALGVLENALRLAGFQDVNVQAVSVMHRYPSAEAFIRSQMGALPGPMRDMINDLSEIDRERLGTAMRRALQRFEGPNGLEAPGESLIGVGTK